MSKVTAKIYRSNNELAATQAVWIADKLVFTTSLTELWNMGWRIDQVDQRDQRGEFRIGTIDTVDLDRDEWLKIFPDHCKKCHGSGMHDHGWSEFGHWFSDVEPCDCVESGCPRCGNPSIWDEDAEDFNPCEHCGWDYYSGDHFECPEEREPVEADRIKTACVVVWQDGMVITSLMTRKQARQLVTQGMARVRSANAIEYITEKIYG